jgi:hypothetical protein
LIEPLSDDLADRAEPGDRDTKRHAGSFRKMTRSHLLLARRAWTRLTHPIGIFGLLVRGWGAVVGGEGTKRVAIGG